MIEANVGVLHRREGEVAQKSKVIQRLLERYEITAATVTLTGQQKLAALSTLAALRADRAAAVTAADEAFNAIDPIIEDGS